jgi:hypothetical protein
MHALSDFQRRKFQLYFELYDFDEDGLMGFYDYLALPNRIAEVSGWPTYCPAYWGLYDDNLMKWRIIQSFSHRSDQRVTLQDWFKYATALQNHREDFNGRIRSGDDATFNAIIAMLDPEHTGIIPATAWSKFTSIWGVLGDPQGLFQRIDTADTRQITYTDLMQLMDDFLFSADLNSTGSYIFGDIPHYASI